MEPLGTGLHACCKKVVNSEGRLTFSVVVNVPQQLSCLTQLAYLQ